MARRVFGGGESQWLTSTPSRQFASRSFGMPDSNPNYGPPPVNTFNERYPAFDQRMYQRAPAQPPLDQLFEQETAPPPTNFLPDTYAYVRGGGLTGSRSGTQYDMPQIGGGGSGGYPTGRWDRNRIAPGEDAAPVQAGAATFGERFNGGQAEPTMHQAQPMTDAPWQPPAPSSFNTRFDAVNDSSWNNNPQVTNWSPSRGNRMAPQWTQGAGGGHVEGSIADNSTDAVLAASERALEAVTANSRAIDNNAWQQTNNIPSGWNRTSTGNLVPQAQPSFMYGGGQSVAGSAFNNLGPSYYVPMGGWA